MFWTTWYLYFITQNDWHITLVHIYICGFVVILGDFDRHQTLTFLSLKQTLFLNQHLFSF